MVRVVRRKRPRVVASMGDFTAADVERMRVLVAEGMRPGGDRGDGWEHELEVIHHIRGRRRGMSRFMWQLDPWGYTVDDAVDEEIRLSVPGGLQRRWSRFCSVCGGLVHGRFHVVGDRYAVGCP